MELSQSSIIEINNSEECPLSESIRNGHHNRKNCINEDRKMQIKVFDEIDDQIFGEYSLNDISQQQNTPPNPKSSSSSQSISEKYLKTKHSAQNIDIEIEIAQNLRKSQIKIENFSINNNFEQFKNDHRDIVFSRDKPHTTQKKEYFKSATQSSQSQLVSKPNTSMFVAGVSENQSQGLHPDWKGQQLRILIIVMRFIMKLKEYSNEYKFNYLRQYQFQVINDLACQYDYYYYNKLIRNHQASQIEVYVWEIGQFFVRKIKRFSKFPGKVSKMISVISPDSTFSLYWNILIFFFLTINICYIPIKLSFEDTHELILNETVKILLNDIPGWLFLTDIVVNFNRAYYKNGLLVKQRSEVIKHYFKGNFLWDFIVIVPFIISLIFDINGLNAILLLRTNQLRKLMQHFEDIWNLKEEKTAILDLVKLVCIVLFVGHFCGCFFYIFHRVQEAYGIETTWVTYNKLDEYFWYEKYITSFYWAVITMITVGYGQIYPVNTQERGFVIFITIASCGVFAYSVNTIGTIMNNLGNRKKKFRNSMNEMTNYLVESGIDQGIIMKIKKYFKFLNKEDNQSRDRCDQMISMLPIQIRKELLLDKFGQNILHKIKMFYLNFTSPFIDAISLQMRECRFGPDQVIYREYHQNDTIYFIIRGEVELFLNGKQSTDQSRNLDYTPIQMIGQGEFFGEVSFFSGRLTRSGSCTKRAVTLACLKRQDFIQVLQRFPIDKEKYNLIKDNFMIYNKYDNLDVRCPSCGQFNHQMHRCQYLTYLPNRDKILNRYHHMVENSVQQRDISFKRSTTREKTSSGRAISAYLQDQVINFLVVKNPFNEDVNELIQRVEMIQMEIGGNERENQEEKDSILKQNENHQIKDSPPKNQGQPQDKDQLREINSFAQVDRVDESPQNRKFNQKIQSFENLRRNSDEIYQANNEVSEANHHRQISYGRDSECERSFADEIFPENNQNGQGNGVNQFGEASNDTQHVESDDYQNIDNSCNQPPDLNNLNYLVLKQHHSDSLVNYANSPQLNNNHINNNSNNTGTNMQKNNINQQTQKSVINLENAGNQDTNYQQQSSPQFNQSSTIGDGNNAKSPNTTKLQRMNQLVNKQSKLNRSSTQQEIMTEFSNQIQVVSTDQKIDNSFSLVPDMDQFSNFTIYHPLFNITRVLDELKNIQNQNDKKQKVFVNEVLSNRKSQSKFISQKFTGLINEQNQFLEEGKIIEDEINFDQNENNLKEIEIQNGKQEEKQLEVITGRFNKNPQKRQSILQLQRIRQVQFNLEEESPQVVINERYLEDNQERLTIPSTENQDDQSIENGDMHNITFQHNRLKDILELDRVKSESKIDEEI